ncbi:MAG: sulfatase-like hydrolase/transferase [Cellvibrionales bacterium]|nr:sulfatase-like hydrolase/transferase [Cellvibrionales bacterium]
MLLILLDDAGYSDVAGFGRNDAPTPNIQSIAQEGVRFTRHYADSTCKPARFGAADGRESARVAQSPDFRGMSPDIVTLADALKTNGYHTAHIGKWHLGDAVRGAWPDQGFDEWFGFLNQFQLKAQMQKVNLLSVPLISIHGCKAITHPTTIPRSPGRYSG